ncbi:hypothetical protein NUW54_g12558 [Trametes sanguinea]|uniref:Uncharacterized protein n=1 Tax=Trametes sanguinea TaxID=158606 RepID=A0ACC1MWH2_9APHY|nr:hypothetical protein NUW54_g12558 [Trametes sanguinea]
MRTLEGPNRPFDPDYEVPNRTKSSKVPTLPRWLEIGIDRGRRFVIDTIAKIPDNVGRSVPHKTLAPNPAKILAFLRNNNYIVTPTDKNLGLAVSERTWIIDQTKKLLNNPKDYRRITYAEATTIFNEKQAEVLAIAALAEEQVELAELGLDEFLRSKLTVKGEAHTFPEFYGIPKIHKNPAGFRPIVPCHSVLMGPAAKHVSKELKPLIKAAPTIIHGSKDLAQKLSKLSLTSKRSDEKWYFVTGDVVAFYPNIPLEKCLGIVNQMWLEFTFGDKILEFSAREEVDGVYRGFVGAQMRKRAEIFRRCMQVSSEKLVSHFDGEHFLQLNGLAMGVPEAPDQANLYGCYFENKANVLSDRRIGFYGRFIDDIFSIVAARSSEQARDIMKSLIQYDECEITWDVSELRCPFLDMTIYFDDNGKLQWKPYRKQKNHMERIPWISHHPLDVKRAHLLG